MAKVLILNLSLHQVFSPLQKQGSLGSNLYSPLNCTIKVRESCQTSKTSQKHNCHCPLLSKETRLSTAMALVSKIPQRRHAERLMFSSSDDNAMLKQIQATHAPDGREVDVGDLLHVIEEIFQHAKPIIDTSGVVLSLYEPPADMIFMIYS